MNCLLNVYKIIALYTVHTYVDKIIAKLLLQWGTNLLWTPWDQLYTSAGVQEGTQVLQATEA